MDDKSLKQKPAVETELLNMYLIGLIELDAKNSNCLCTKSLLAPPTIELKTHEVQAVFFGECCHAFHAVCLSSFMSANGDVCPICKTPWIVKYPTNQTISKN